MSFKITALSVDLAEDLLPLSAMLHHRKLGHRIFEQGGRQVLKVDTQASVEEVTSLYTDWRSGQIKIELVKKQKHGKKPAAVAWRKVPVTLGLVFLSFCGFLLDASVSRDGKIVARADALNDVVVNSGTSAQMIEYELYIDEKFVYRQRADGLIVSTPTGSTAYSLSGGGPIMHPTLDAVVLVPMFPHALSSRPIVVDGNSEIRIEILERNRIHPPVTCDGQVNMTVRPGDSVHVSKKPHRLTLLHPVGHSFYASCRDKLSWSHALVG
jgi:hypothetical protein